MDKLKPGDIVKTPDLECADCNGTGRLAGGFFGTGRVYHRVYRPCHCTRPVVTLPDPNVPQYWEYEFGPPDGSVTMTYTEGDAEAGAAVTYDSPYPEDRHKPINNGPSPHTPSDAPGYGSNGRHADGE